jgi:hypothetical protein
MNLQHTIHVFFTLTIALSAAAVSAAQTADQALNVRIVPTTTVEERVANEAKEKELREKLAANEAVRIESTNPKALLGHARILFVSSNTNYFEAVQLENALRKRNEIDAWELAMVDDWQKRDVADTHVEIDRPFFTFTFTYKLTNRKTALVLATGKVNAMDSNAAAPMLAARIVEEIRKARGETKKK